MGISTATSKTGRYINSARLSYIAGLPTTWLNWTAGCLCSAATTATRACTRRSGTIPGSIGGQCRRRCRHVEARWAPLYCTASTWTASWRRLPTPQILSPSWVEAPRWWPPVLERRPSQIHRSSPPPRPYDCRGRPPTAGGRTMTTIPNVLTRCLTSERARRSKRF